jgi:hypothetical protein
MWTRNESKPMRRLGLDAALVIMLVASPLTGGDGDEPPAAAAPTHQLTGTWEPIPPPPGGRRITDAVLLPDGRIAVMHHEFFEDDVDESPVVGCLSVYTPTTQTWEQPELDWPRAWPQCFSFQDFFVRAPNGLLYSANGVAVDPATWTVESGPWPNEYGFFNSIGATLSGEVYVPVMINDETRLHPIDVESGELGTPAAIKDFYDFIVGGPSAMVFIGHDAGDGKDDQFISYDPVSDAWQVETPAPERMRWTRAQHGPGGWMYAPASGNEVRAVYARNPSDGSWLSVPLPSGFQADWGPFFVDGGDGRLYVFDSHQSYVFTPGPIEPIPMPEPPDGGGGATAPSPTPDAPSGLLPDTATERGTGRGIAIDAVALLLSTALLVIGIRHRRRSMA